MHYDTQGFATAVDGTRLFYGVRGSGTPIVLCDGIGCDGWAWARFHEELARHSQVIHWHYRGHGRSGSPLDPTRVDIAALARDARSVLDHLGVESAIFTGHSMGVQVCLEMLRESRERVAGLVLVCGSYGGVTKTFKGTDALANVLPAVRDFFERFGPLVRTVWSRIPVTLSYRIAKMTGEIDAFCLSEDDFKGYIEHMSTLDPNLFVTMLEHAGEHSASDLLETITVPTLVISGELDSFTPPELSTTMAERIPGAELFVVRGGTHSAPVEQPHTVLMRVEKFLGERFGTSPQ
jgi:pimeloyl-ACP methyl ester carboxylesterase